MEDNHDYLSARNWGSEIGKIKKGDRVLVNVISEPLQEHYNQIMAKREEFNEKVEKLKSIYSSPEEMTLEEAKEIRMLNHEIDKIRDDFWIKVTDQYGLWKTPSVGIRNGYCLVKTMGPEDFMKRIKTFMDELSDEINGE